MHLPAFTPLLLALLPTTLSALPDSDAPILAARHSLSARDFDAYLAANNISVITGSYDVSQEGLAKRGEAPEECRLVQNVLIPGGGRSTWNYVYFYDLPDGGHACFGYQNADACGGDEAWAENERLDITRVLNDQVTKDGQFKSSDSGK